MKRQTRLARGDIEGFLRFCADDTEWTYVGDQTLKAKKAVRRYMARRMPDHQNLASPSNRRKRWVTALGRSR